MKPHEETWIAEPHGNACECSSRIVLDGDTSDDAYEKVVDRLLRSPRYGEHMSRYWLDAVRYGDTHGLHLDNERLMWAYRDWVVRAFNENLPFDQFTVEQLAGDLLPGATVAQQAATGFHRNTMLNEEGGIDPLEFRYHAMVDRVHTTSTAWLGLTFACAQCHNHKYDPFTSKDFYSMEAFFADIGDKENGTPGLDGRVVHGFRDGEQTG